MWLLTSCSPVSLCVHEHLIGIVRRGHGAGGRHHGHRLGRHVVAAVGGQRLCEDAHWAADTGSCEDAQTLVCVVLYVVLCYVLSKPGAATCSGVVGTLLPPPSSSWAARKRGDSYIPRPARTHTRRFDSVINSYTTFQLVLQLLCFLGVTSWLVTLHVRFHQWLNWR